MRRPKISITVTAGFLIFFAIAICLLPLKWVVSWLLALVIHEASHCIAVIICGANLRKLRITLFGAELTADIDATWKELLCSIAGPIGGFLLVFLRGILPATAVCACIHSAYNLLPLKNLDGGKALRGLLCMLCKTDRAIVIADSTDKVTRFVLLGLAIYLSWRLKWTVLAIFAILLLFIRQGRVKSTCKPKKLRVQ